MKRLLFALAVGLLPLLSQAEAKRPNILFIIADDQSPFDLKDRKSTRLNSSHKPISYAVFCLKKKKNNNNTLITRSVQFTT